MTVMDDDNTTPVVTDDSVQYQASFHQQLFSGPLPPPDDLEKYEKISPGFADRIVQMAEKEADHRRNVDMINLGLDKELLAAHSRTTFIGQLFGLGIGVLALLTCAYLIINGHEVSGALIGTTGITGLVAVFVIGRRKKPAPE